MPPLIGAALIAAVPSIFGITILGTTIGSIVGSIIVLGASFGAEMLLTKRGNGQPSIKLPPGPVSFEPEIQAVAGRFFSYGSVRLGGIYCFRESDGSTLGYGLVLSCRPIDAVEGFFVDDELLSLSTGPVLHQAVGPGGIYVVHVEDEGPTAPWPDKGLKWTAFVSYVWTPQGPMPIIVGSGPAGFLEFNNASEAGTPSVLLKKYFGEGSPTQVAPGGAALWTDDHKAQGLAVLYSVWKGFEAINRVTVFPRLFPVHSTAFRGARVYDPRDAAQSFLDPVTGRYSVYNSTWRYSANTILQIADFLTFPEAFGLAPSKIHWPSFSTEASYCDRLVPTYGGGTEPFARSHLTWSSEEEKRDVLAKLLVACDAQIWEDNNGKIRIWVGKWEEPTVEFTPADISAFVAEQGNGVYADSNYIVPSYVEPRTNFSKNTALSYRDAGSIAQVGERRATMDLSAVESFNQAYRLAARALKRKNTPSRLQISGGPRLLLADGERVVRVTLPEFGIAGVYRVQAMKADDLAHIGLTLSLVTEDMYANEVAPFDPINPSLPGIPKVVSFTPIQPWYPSLSAAIVTGPSPTATISAGVLAPNVMPVNPLIPPIEYQDTTSTTRFQSRPVDVSTHASLGDWVVWHDFIGQYAGVSPTINGTTGVHQAFEVQAWFVTTQDIPGPLSPSSFITVNF